MEAGPRLAAPAAELRRPTAASCQGRAAAAGHGSILRQPEAAAAGAEAEERRMKRPRPLVVLLTVALAIALAPSTATAAMEVEPGSASLRLLNAAGEPEVRAGAHPD